MRHFLKQFALKLKQKRNRDPLLSAKKLRLEHAQAYVRLRLRLKWLNEGKWSPGTGQAVNLSPTFEEFLRLEVENSPKFDEEYQILHELVCGGTVRFMPKWVMDKVNVPPSWYCIKCNKLFVEGTDIESQLTATQH